MARSGKDSDDEQNKDKWDGDPLGLEDFDKKMGRWCRKQYGTQLGNDFWANDMQDISLLTGSTWDDYCEMVWDAINDVDATKAKFLYPVASGFWGKAWHKAWTRKQYDRIYDKVEALVSGSAALEVQSLGMHRSPLLRDHIHKHFGGAGDDVRAREEQYADGMPAAAGLPGFPEGVNMEDKLRVLQGERIALWKMCKPSKRKEYEYGKESKLVKIVLKGLRNSEYQESIDSLLQEIKMKRNFDSRLPVINILSGLLELPTQIEENTINDDWDYRNYSDDWLPSWEDLKSKLISVFKAKKFAIGSSTAEPKKKLPLMFTPSFGINPKVQCFGCGGFGHRKGMEECKAGPNWLPWRVLYSTGPQYPYKRPVILMTGTVAGTVGYCIYI
jgi:hypothetical protein